MQSSINDCSDQEQLKKVSGFLQICKGYEHSKDNEQKLAMCGYRQFENKKVSVDVIGGKVKLLNDFIETRTQKLNSWTTQLKEIYENNFKAAHLQGKKLSEFYSFISQNQ